MAQIENDNRRKIKNCTTKKTVKVDLTPMVDLGFLLITFFILSTTLSQPTIASLVMPKDATIHTLIKESAVLTLMLTRNDSVGFYEGTMPKQELIKHCTFSDLRSVIQQKQKKVADVLGDRMAMVIIICPGNQSTYKNFMDLLDEIQINDVRHYLVMGAK
ncbi:MAG: biopolymer transporter ExbD [Ginsengibacter sp.]